jgi:hypothetical protein
LQWRMRLCLLATCPHQIIVLLCCLQSIQIASYIHRGKKPTGGKKH